jgi:response regulator of citrate/malate metabolism
MKVKKVTKVLLIEDSTAMQSRISQMIKKVFGDETDVVIAGSLQEAEDLYQAHVGDVDMILMDTHLGEGTNTTALAKRISLEFNRPIIAISTNKDSRKTLINNGWCTHQCCKSEILKFLTEWKEKHQ